MNQHNFFLLFSLVLIMLSVTSNASEYIKISKMQKDSVIARYQKEKKVMKQRLQEIQRLKNEHEQAINALDTDIKEAKYQIVELERELIEYPEDPEMQVEITSDSNKFKESLQRYEDERKRLQEKNEALLKESIYINDKLNAFR